MATLSAKERARLPDRAFAYVDSRGQRRLPIHDAAHVRNALSRFDQVPFEDDAARDRARNRLLNAAKQHGIIPIGFVNAQLQPEKKLPAGQVVFLLADIEGSTELLQRLGDEYSTLLVDVRRLVRAAVRPARGHVVSARGDDVFAVFSDAAAALRASLDIQRHMQEHSWPGGLECRLRIGLHRGRPQLTETGYAGICARRGADLLLGARWSDRDVVGGAHGARQVAARRRDAEVARRVALPGDAGAGQDLSGRDAGPVERLPAAAVGEASAMTEGVIAVDDQRAERPQVQHCRSGPARIPRRWLGDPTSG